MLLFFQRLAILLMVTKMFVPLLGLAAVSTHRQFFHKEIFGFGDLF